MGNSDKSTLKAFIRYADIKCDLSRLQQHICCGGSLYRPVNIERLVIRREENKMTKDQSKLIDIIDDMCETKDILFHMMRSVKDIMTYNVKTLTLDDTIGTCLEIMTENKIRHIPVVKNDTKQERFTYSFSSTSGAVTSSFTSTSTGCLMPFSR